MLDLIGTQEIRTPRLLLRRMTLDDAPAMFDTWANDERVTRFMNWEPHGTIEETKRILRAWLNTYADETFYQWGVEYEGALVGSMGAVSLSVINQHCEIGYCIGCDYWGKGIVTEAVQGVLGFLFREVKLNRVYAKYDVLNPASGRVMEKCGMTCEGTLRQHTLRKDGYFGDLRQYGILREEYEAQQASRQGAK